MSRPVKKKVLILCTGNSCRSQLAEALINSRLSDSWHAWSAGTEPAGGIHPMVITALKEIGVDHLGRSKSISELQQKDFDLVITVCDKAKETCPAWLGRGNQVHITFPDPAQAAGSNLEQLARFRSVRDDIADKILGYLKYLSFQDHKQARSSDE